MKKRVCLIGGSGFVGRAIAKQCSEAGYHVTVACRHPEKARDMLVDGVRLAKADISDGKGLDEAMQGADCVINLVGLLAESGRFTFESVHVLGMEHVIETAQRLGIPQYLHMSALGAGKVPESVYASTKGEAESRVKESDLNWTIIRPSIIYGRGDSFFNKFKMLSAIGPVFPVLAPDTKFQPVWVEDVARVFVQCIGNRHVVSQTFELGGPAQYSFESLIQMLMDALGRQRILIRVPDAMGKMLAASPLPMITSDQWRLLQHDNLVEGEPFPSQFGQPARVEDVLPTYICGDQPNRLQNRLSTLRQSYRN